MAIGKGQIASERYIDGVGCKQEPELSPPT